MKKTLAHYNVQGVSYVEVLIAVVLLSAVLVPLLQSLQSGIQSKEIYSELTESNFHVIDKMELVLSKRFQDLYQESMSTNNYQTPSVLYSDPAGSENRRLVYLSYYDIDNNDADSNFFTIQDADSDLDGNPYTGSDVNINILWLAVEIENSSHRLESLTAE